jgi:4-amino-4-deoxy-L-arabinose transferase-like glycosyltransferase
MLGRGSRRPVPWEQLGLAFLLIATAATFMWGLDRNGWANPYYSAAAQAGSQDWKAFFYGSLDAGNLITVDKPPLSIWIMSLSVRLFGLNSWALLVPQALMGVTTTWLIYKIIRRSHTAAPALLGGLIYATTPVVVLMSRYNNPEPLMGLLTVAAVYFVLRAIEDNRWTWYLLAGTSLGLGFMAKQIQAFLPIPALVLAVLLFGAGTLASRLLRLLASLAALIISGGWWMAIVELTPAANRPYIGGSATNSILELTLDYNGLARFIRLPAESSSTAPSNQAVAAYDGGLARLFNGNFAPEGGWLLSTAVICIIVAAVLRSLSPQGKHAKAAILLSGVWFVTVFIVLSFMGTMIHSYYVYSLGAPLAMAVAMGLSILWRNSDRLSVRLIGATTVAATSYMSIRILEYGLGWSPLLIPIVASIGVVSTVAWLSCPKTKLCLAFVAVAMVIGPVVSNAQTIATPQKGTNPVSGPVSSDPRAISRHLQNVKAGRPAWALHIAFGSTPSPKVTQLLQDVDPKVMWPAATYTAQNAAQYQLETHRPVLAVGGWLGTDPAPTLDEFKALVADKKIAYFIWQQDLLDLGGLGRDAAAISMWVRSTFVDITIDGTRIYDLRS